MMGEDGWPPPSGDGGVEGLLTCHGWVVAVGPPRSWRHFTSDQRAARPVHRSMLTKLRRISRVRSQSVLQFFHKNNSPEQECLSHLISRIQSVIVAERKLFSNAALLVRIGQKSENFNVSDRSLKPGIIHGPHTPVAI